MRGNKINIITGVMALVLALCCFFTACEGPAGPAGKKGADGPSSPTYLLVFRANGGIFEDGTDTFMLFSRGGTVTPPQVSRQSLTLDGWYTQESGGNAFNFSATVTGNHVLYALWSYNGASVSEIREYLLTSPSGLSPYDPLRLAASIDLGTTAEKDSGWRQLLEVIQASGKYIDLDLSGSTMDGTEFDPVYGLVAGKTRIYSLVLPDVAESIKESDSNSFSEFSNLKACGGANIMSIGYYAFQGCTSLTSLDFPALEIIDEGVFSGCTALTSVSFPLVTSLGGYAFGNCTALTSASFPLAEDINNSAFNSCNKLVGAEFPVAQSIGNNAFEGCSSLTNVNFPEVKSVGQYGFRDCYALVSIDMPLLEDIGFNGFMSCTSLDNLYLPSLKNAGSGTGSGQAFSGCTSLTSANLPSLINLYSSAFYNCSALTSVYMPKVEYIDGSFALGSNLPLTITMGASAPTVGIIMFFYTSSKTVTVKVPVGATGYAASLPFNVSGADLTPNWGNAFRGLGWNPTDGYGTNTGNINTSITLRIEEYTE